MPEHIQVLYRKYRPTTFKSVIGQDHIVGVLESSVKSGNVAHAYLFSGSRGTGKTSVARILASSIKCSPNDLYEIDAASNRGIDDIRELRDGVSTLPFESPYKVYIVDEVHMLTKEAFNALLKTLEEPPEHAVFILATTELEKVPETIISRCQNFIFGKPSRKILKDNVLHIAKKEGFVMESAGAELIAILAEGSFRDAQGILQKVISSSKKGKISAEAVEKVTGAPKASLVNKVVEAVSKRDLEKGLGAVQNASAQNLDMKIFMKLLLHKVRSVMLLKYAPELEKVVKEQFGEEDFKFLKGLSGEKDSFVNSKALSELLRAYDETGRSYIQTLPLELALVRIVREDE